MVLKIVERVLKAKSRTNLFKTSVLHLLNVLNGFSRQSNRFEQT